MSTFESTFEPPPLRLTQALDVAASLCLANLVLGWSLGYDSLAGYFIFWLFSALAGLTAVLIVQRVFPPNGLVDAVIRTGVVSFALIVLCELVLGSVGRLAPGPYLSLQLLVLGVCSFLRSPRAPAWRPNLPRVPLPIVAVSVAMLAFMLGFGITHAPLTLYDSLSYHLFFPARWLQDHRLSIIATPFSDEAQAYQPGNGELFFLWLMLPFHGTLVARIGQLPFYLLGGITLYALARQMGVTRAHAVYAPMFFFLSRPIVEQAVGADVDLICATMFLTSLYLGIAAVTSDERRDWAVWGVSLGLFWGAKYLALVYTPVFLLLPVVRGLRPRAAWALPGVLALALPWYLRNWLVAGSPLYPSSLAIAGMTIAPGAFTHSAMMNSEQHTASLRLFPIIASHAFGAALFLVWLPVAVLALWPLSTHARRWPAAFVLLAPIGMIPLYWFGVPDNIDSRFLMPAAVTAMVPFACAFRESRIWNGLVHAFYAAGVIWLLVGLDAELPVALPWNMRGWLSLQGLIERHDLVLFVAAAAITALVWSTARSSRYALPVLAGLISVGSVALAVGSQVWCVPSPCDVLQTTSPFIRPSFVVAWRWVAEHADHATIAYTGNNLPFPLAGEHLTNRVYYVNIDEHPTWRFHDYDRAERARGAIERRADLLATSSGVLRPVRRRDGPHNAARPRYERMRGEPEAWARNLKRLGVDHLFVSTLSAWEIDYNWHNDGGFPIEDEWARARPEAFSVVYENAEVRIYAVNVR